MDEKLKRAVETFITGRINDLGTDAPEAVTEAITEVNSCLNVLAEAIPPEQAPLLRALENALSTQTGEETRYYYSSGFYDAIQFLLEKPTE